MKISKNRQSFFTRPSTLSLDFHTIPRTDKSINTSPLLLSDRVPLVQSGIIRIFPSLLLFHCNFCRAPSVSQSGCRMRKHFGHETAGRNDMQLGIGEEDTFLE